MNQNDKIQFLPFHAINEFMKPEYRLKVIRFTLNAIMDLPEKVRKPIHKIIQEYVSVPGFRNSVKAPIQILINPTVDAFEKRPELVATILAIWSEAHHDLRNKVFNLLKERNWNILPLETDRTKLPGFLTVWPVGEEFETLNNAFIQKYSNESIEFDDISLMVVWLSVSLPYRFVEKDEIEKFFH